MYNVSIILFCCLCYTVASGREVGDECILPTKDKGSCSTLSNCPYAQNLLRTGNTPVSCGFVRTEPVVCCVKDLAENPEPYKVPSKVLDVDIPHSLSEKKCVEWYPRPLYNQYFLIGGNLSLPQEFPHMAIIGYGPEDNIEWRCGGSLVHPKFVLTAAHCLRAKDLGEARWARLGDLDISTDTDDAMPQTRLIIRRIPHPSYRPPQRYHDIALLELDRSTEKTFYVAPACLPTKNIPAINTLTATGWGATEFGGSIINHLMKLNLGYIPNEQCVKSFGKVSPNILPNGIRDDIQICAGGVIGEDTCQGDSGGPLQMPHIFRNFLIKVHIIIGITSFGKACGLSRAPGIYTRVSSYVPWIESILWPNEKF